MAENHFEFLSLKGGCTGWSESTLVKIPHCWKSHFAAHLLTNAREFGKLSRQRASNAQASLRICADSPGPSLLGIRSEVGPLNTPAC